MSKKLEITEKGPVGKVHAEEAAGLLVKGVFNV